jgi:hypothetical protein
MPKQVSEERLRVSWSSIAILGIIVFHTKECVPDKKEKRAKIAVEDER